MHTPAYEWPLWIFSPHHDHPFLGGADGEDPRRPTARIKYVLYDHHQNSPEVDAVRRETSTSGRDQILKNVVAIVPVSSASETEQHERSECKVELAA